MAMNADATLRNTWLDAIATRAGANPKIRGRTGTKPASAGATRTGTVLVTITLTGGFNAASGGSMSIATPGVTGAAATTGDIGHWELVDNAGTLVVLQGDVGELLSFDTNTITASGQVVSISSFAITAPNA